MGRLTEKYNDKHNRIINCAIRWSQVDNEQLQKAIDKLAEYENLGEITNIKIALEKQKPKEPIETDYDGYVCPVCYGGNLIQPEIVDNIHQVSNYCNECGKKIDWD